MTKAPHIYLLIPFALIAVAGAGRFDGYIAGRDFTLIVTSPCNPEAQNCFVQDCPADGLECDATPYAKARVEAADAPTCLEEHACSTFSCDGLRACSITYCTPGALEDGEQCAMGAPALKPNASSHAD